jgi:hypothetical protein
MASTSFGSTWLMLDRRLGLRTSPVNVQRLGSIDLRKYNVLILPHSWRPSTLGAVLDEKVLKRIKRWVEAGGTLITLGGTSAFVAGKDRGLTSVRLRRDVLDELEVYEEAVERELAAGDIKIDPGVWKAQPSTDSDESSASEKGDKPGAKSDTDALKRTDAWQRTFSPSGAMVAASLDPEHWLCFGLGDKLPVLFSGSHVFLSKHPVATPARLRDQDDLRLSGLLWPEARERMAESAYATVERVGSGQIILFASLPTRSSAGISKAAAACSSTRSSSARVWERRLHRRGEEW